MLVSNNKVLKINSKWLKAQVLYYITLVQPTGGTITASTLVATPGTIITLSNVSDTGYTFDSYTINGEPIVGNTFILGDEDVIVSANYIHNILSVNIIQSTGGTVTATPVTGYYGTTITLSQVTEDPNYTFDYYTVDGTSISGNTFVLGEDSVDVKGKYTGNFNPLNLPAYTMRLKFTDGITPSFERGTTTQVSSSPNVWDLTYNDTNWSGLIHDQTELLEVLGANTTGVTDMCSRYPIPDQPSSYTNKGLFINCTKLTKVELFDITTAKICVDSQASYGGMFYGCSALTSVPWFDTSNCTSLRELFKDCSSLTSVPRFDTSNVTNMSDMFYDCSSLTTVPLFNTANVTNMSSIFDGCSSLTTVPLFNTSKVTDMSYMFSRCSTLTSVPWFDTSNVTNMSGMFSTCRNISTVPLFNTSKVTDMSYMFMQGPSSNSLKTIPLFDTSNVTNMRSMLQANTGLTSVPLFDTSNVTNMTEMLYLCEGISSLPLFNTSKVVTMESAFRACSSVESGALALYQQASTQTTPPTNHSRTFENCGWITTTGAAELAQIPSSWGGTGA